MTVVIVSGLVHRYNKTSFLRSAVQMYSAVFFALHQNSAALDEWCETMV